MANRPICEPDQPVRIGVSSCLVGNEVRFDGGHKRNEFLLEMLGRFVEFVPVCPEVEIGLGVPRETLRLEHRHGIAGEARLVGNTTGIDYSNRMNSYAKARVIALGRQELSGYLLKKNSPSCGLDGVHIYSASGTATRDGTGLFAAALMRRYPSLPVEEEVRLADRRLCENFIERVFAYSCLRSFFVSQWDLPALVQFHSAHRPMLKAYSPNAYRELARFLASANEMACSDIRRRYEMAFMQALKNPAAA